MEPIHPFRITDMLNASISVENTSMLSFNSNNDELESKNGNVSDTIKSIYEQINNSMNKSI